MKNLIVVFTLAASSPLFAADQVMIVDPPKLPASVKNMTPEQRAASIARKQANFQKRTGGWILKRDKDSRPFRIVNAQKKVPAAAFNDVLKGLDEFSHFDFEFKDGTFSGKGEKGVIYLIDDAAQPSMVIVPEEGWGTVNVAKLGDKNLEKRACKELWRCFGYVCGAADTEMPHCVMRPVWSPEDLDFIDGTGLCPEPRGKIIRHMRTINVKPYVRLTYEYACREGWAPAPTNENQKAIWEKVHALPKTPLKIEFDPKKGE